jgi:hypothetical protein
VKKTLTTELKGGPFSIARALSIAIALARIIKELHEKNQIHGCISSESVTLAGKDKLELNYEVIEPGQISDPNYQQNLPIDVILSVPPEVWQNQEWSKSCDIFGLGSTLYYMITGKPIFEGDKPRDLIALLIYSEIVPPITFNKDVPLWLNSLIMRMLATNREERVPTIGEVIATIENRERNIATLQPIKAQSPQTVRSLSGQRAYSKTSSKIRSASQYSLRAQFNDEELSLNAKISKHLIITAIILASLGLTLLAWYQQIEMKRFLMSLPYPVYFLWPLLPILCLAPTLSLAPLIVGQFGRNLNSVFKSWLGLSLATGLLGITTYLCNLIGYSVLNETSRPAMDHFDLLTVTKVTIAQLIQMMCLSPLMVEYEIVPQISLSLEADPLSMLSFPTSYPILLALAALGIYVACAWENNKPFGRITPTLFFIPVLLELLLMIIWKLFFSSSFPVTISQFEIFDSTAFYSKLGLWLGLFNYVLIASACVVSRTRS